jgi:hypothetical protein
VEPDLALVVARHDDRVLDLDHVLARELRQLVAHFSAVARSS